MRGARTLAMVLYVLCQFQSNFGKFWVKREGWREDELEP